jgi:hypothetical protein
MSLTEVPPILEPGYIHVHKLAEPNRNTIRWKLTCIRQREIQEDTAMPAIVRRYTRPGVGV